MSAHSDPTATLLPDGPAARIEPVMGGGGLAFMGGKVSFAEEKVPETETEEKIPVDETEPTQPKEQKPNKPSVTFTAEEQSILSEYGLGPGGPISLDVDDITKEAFLKQRKSKTCAKGTGDVVVMNSKCWAVVAVIRALLSHNIRSANTLPVVVPVEEEEEDTKSVLPSNTLQPNLPISDEAVHTLLENLQKSLTEGKPIQSFRLSVLKHLLKFPAGRSYVIHRILTSLPESLEKMENAGLEALKQNVQSALSAVKASA